MSEEKVNKGSRRGIKVIGIIMLLMGLIGILIGIIDFFNKAQESKTENNPIAFNSLEGREELKYIDMIALSECVATFDVGESQGIYMAFDEEGNSYLICISEKDFEKYNKNHDYFYDMDSMAVPDSKRIQGYPMKIDGDLIDFTIEFADVVFGKGVVTQDNFSELFGSYYLDATYHPKSEENEAFSILAASCFLFIAGIVLIIISGRKTSAKGIRDWEDKVLSDNDPNDGSGYMTAVLEEVPVNHGLGILGAILGALGGAALWIGIYQLGYVVWVVGYLTVIFAVFLYKKLAKGIGIAGIALCGLISSLMLCFADVTAISFEIVKYINAEYPGRASLLYVVSHFTEMMTSYELWGDFLIELLLGVIMAIAAAVSLIIKYRKKQQN